jgi:hypothetical protein
VSVRQAAGKQAGGKQGKQGSKMSKAAANRKSKILNNTEKHN